VVAERIEDLDPDNREAWQLFGRIVSRLTMDVPGLVTPIMDRMVADLASDDALDLLQRLSVIYDTVIPPKPTV
jgi:tetrahydromethanopterin S-methyltransferase subunit C